MTSGLVNASFSLDEWQAVEMIFFALCHLVKTNVNQNVSPGTEIVVFNERCRDVWFNWSEQPTNNYKTAKYLPTKQKTQRKTAWLVYCKTYTSIAPNNYLVSSAHKHSNIFAVTLIQFDKEFEVIHYFISSKCRLFENFPSINSDWNACRLGYRRMQNAKMTLKFSD